MPHGSVKLILPAPSEVVFPLLHDYTRRLEWDTLLASAKLCDGASEAGLGVTSVCTGKWYLGGIPMQTEYVTFTPPRVAAVKLVNRPRLFESFAATIRHDNLGDGTSQVEYIYNFAARPGWLRWLLEPVMAAVFRWETGKRLRALGRYAEQMPAIAVE
jgi:hypothetical protein